MPYEKQLSDLTLDELMQKAQGIQENMKSALNKLANAKVIGIAGNNEVQVEINGKYQVLNVTITDSAYADKSKLENLIVIAVNDALSKLEAIAGK